MFGSGIYDPQKEREGDVSYEEQLKGLEKVIKAGKVAQMFVSDVVWLAICLLLVISMVTPLFPCTSYFCSTTLRTCEEQLRGVEKVKR